jgi:hypothetical protein
LSLVPAVDDISVSRVEGCRDSSVRERTDIDEWIWLYRELLATNRSLCEGFAATRASDADGDGEPREPDIALLRTEFERLQGRLRFWKEQRSPAPAASNRLSQG